MLELKRLAVANLASRHCFGFGLQPDSDDLSSTDTLETHYNFVYSDKQPANAWPAQTQGGSLGLPAWFTL